METVPHPSSTLLSSEENDVSADCSGIFNIRWNGMPFFTHPRLFTCASCRIYGFWDHEKLVTKLEDVVVQNKRPLQPAERIGQVADSSARPPFDKQRLFAPSL